LKRYRDLVIKKINKIIFDIQKDNKTKTKTKTKAADRSQKGREENTSAELEEIVR
jgi:hypothetical protein